MIFIIVILSAAFCNAALLLFAIHEKTGKSVSIEFDEDASADLSILDLAEILFNLTEAATDLPKEFITANAIRITYAGRVLNQTAILSEGGVCNEAQMYYGPNVHQIDARAYYRNTMLHTQTSHFEWIYEIPVGCSDFVNEVMEQTKAKCQLESELFGTDIPDGNHILSLSLYFSFGRRDTAWPTMITDGDRNVIYAEFAALVGTIDEYGDVWSSFTRVIRHLGDSNDELGEFSPLLNIELFFDEDVVFLFEPFA